MEDLEEKNAETRRKNYERALFAIAVLYSQTLDVNIKRQTEYSELTPAQKTFAKKKFEQTPSLQNVVEQPERMTEQQLVEEMAQISKTQNNSKRLRIVTVGDDRVCEKCAKWNGKTVTLDENGPSPTLDDAINDGFLHYGCRCSLQELATAEIPLNPLNPRYDQRKAANPRIYNSKLNGVLLVFN